MGQEIENNILEIGYKKTLNILEKGRNKILSASFGNLEEAKAALKINKTHLCIADINGSGMHLLTPEGGIFTLYRDEMMIGDLKMKIKEFVDKRLGESGWFKSVQISNKKSLVEFPKIGDRVLNLVKKMNMLTDESGNISFSLDKEGLLVTPRGVDKSTIAKSDFIKCKSGKMKGEILYYGNRKTSIDSGMQTVLYGYSNAIKAIIHSHNIWAINVSQTHFPYPCGSLEEAKEIINSGVFECKDNNIMLTYLINHGAVWFIRNIEDIKKVEDQWIMIINDFEAHMKEVSHNIPSSSKLFPIMSGEGVIGYTLLFEDQSWSVRIHPNFQGQGYGKALIAKIIKEGKIIRTIEECGMIEQLKNSGFEIINESENGEKWLKYRGETIKSLEA